MKGLSELIDSLEVKFFKLNKKIILIEGENKELKQKLVKTEVLQEQQTSEINALKGQIENLKMVNSLLGSTENKRETKLKINTLIREIDYCITQLSD
jgi:chromosome segregation ATPase